MFKYGLRLSFGTFTQLIAVIISYEFFFIYAANHGGIGAINSISAVNPIIWVIIGLESMMSIYLLVIGIKEKTNSSKEH